MPHHIISWGYMMAPSSFCEMTLQERRISTWASECSARCVYPGGPARQHLDNYYFTFRQPHFNMHTRCLGKIAISLYIICNICRPVSPAHYLSWLPLCLSAASRKILVINVLRAFRHLSLSLLCCCWRQFCHYFVFPCPLLLIYTPLCGVENYCTIVYAAIERECVFIYREELHTRYIACAQSPIKVWWIIFSEYYIGELPGCDDCVTVRNWNEPWCTSKVPVLVYIELHFTCRW